LLGIILAPFGVGYRVLLTFYRTILYIFALLPQRMRPRLVTRSIGNGFRSTNGRRMLLPRDTAARFKREFDEEYGPNDLPFLEEGVAQAQDQAKRELKFLLVVLMSPEHDDTESFTRETLLAPEVVAFINDSSNNILLWGGNVLDSEAYQVSSEYNCTKFPFSALICLTPKEGSTRMGIVKRLAGPMPPATYIAEIQNAMDRYAPDLAAVRSERSAQEYTRSLRSEQNSAYEISLARDRERARQKREAEAAAVEAEEKAKAEAATAARLDETRLRWRKWRATTITEEPPTTAKDVVRIALKMPPSSGAGRIVRRFAGETTLEELYAFVDCYDILENAAEVEKADRPRDYEHEYGFQIASLMPRAIIPPSKDTSMAKGIGRSGNLIVEAVSPEWDDDEEGGE
jgi:FAS-associated factor 2